MVLETTTLPIELHPYNHALKRIAKLDELKLKTNVMLIIFQDHICFNGF